jgi:hypothetical protein
VLPHAGLVASSGFQIQWGDVATWVGGIATAVALFLTWRLLLLTRQEQRETELQQRQAQARLVSVWCDRVGPELSNGYHTITVKLQNISDEPIYGVRAAVGAGWIGDSISFEELSIIYIVPPKSDQEQNISVRLDRAPDGTREPSPPVEVIFYDATHRVLWLRDRFGRLVQITDDGSQSVARHFFSNPGPAQPNSKP